MMTDDNQRWNRVPEVWMILGLLGAMVTGSFGLLYAAVRHPDPPTQAPRAIASPLPPSQALRPADDGAP